MSTSASLGYRASDGAAYQVFLGRWTEVLAPVFLEFARISSDGAVLDVGCGTGAAWLRRSHAADPVVE
jgi:methylase of polypeptide subunit release factors